MASESPINDGFRTAFRQPEVVLAEIAWRWSFGLAALAIVIGSFVAYLDTLPITNLAVLALRSRVGWLVADAIGHMLRGSGPRLLQMVAIVLPAILILWVAAATIGRTATLEALLGRERVPLAPQLGLNFLRAGVTLASLVGYLGALLIAGRAAADEAEVRPGVFLVVFVILGIAVALVRSRVNWFLCLGAIPAARERRDTFTALKEAVDLFCRHPAKFAGAGAIFGTIHCVLFAFTIVLCMLVLSLAGKAPPVVPLFLFTVITLAYFAVVDFLGIARLAAYVAVDENDRRPPAVVLAPQSPPPAPELPPISEPPPADQGLPNPEAAT